VAGIARVHTRWIPIIHPMGGWASCFFRTNSRDFLVIPRSVFQLADHGDTEFMVTGGNVARGNVLNTSLLQYERNGRSMVRT
jgi:hypothetical protein